MSTTIGWIAELVGVQKLWAFLDGKKTYISAALGILTSIAGLIGELVPLISAHNTAGLFAWAQALPADASWLSLIAALGLLGIGHAVKKTVATDSSSAPKE